MYVKLILYIKIQIIKELLTLTFPACSRCHLSYSCTCDLAQFLSPATCALVCYDFTVFVSARTIWRQQRDSILCAVAPSTITFSSK